MSAAKKAKKKTAKTRTRAATKSPRAAEPIDPRFAKVADAFADDADVTVGKMMAVYGLKVRGKIFAMVRNGRLVVKLPKPRVDALVDSGKGVRFEPGPGRVMKEWVELESPRAWTELATEAKAFVEGGR